MRPTIVYVAQFFPYLTETFVYREVEALRQNGFKVITVANRTPEPAKLSEESIDFMADTTYVFPIQWGKFILAHLAMLAGRPIQYLKTFASVNFRRNEKLRNRIRTLGHFAGGVYLAHQVQDSGAQHVHAHFSVNAATIGMVMADFLGVGFSFTVHNNIFTDQLILKKKLKAADFIVSISEFSKQYLLDFAPEQRDLEKKFHIVHCGISPESFERKNGFASSEIPLVFSVSNHAERKGYPYLVEACRILKEKGYRFQCVIGGAGPQFELLQQLIKAHQLGDVVKLPGTIFQEELRDYLERAAMFVLPCVVAEDGDMDGIPVVLMEAMAMQVPVISTTVSGVPELITHNQTGLLTSEKNAEALAEAIERYLQEPAFARKLGVAGRKTIENGYNIHVSTQQLETLFKSYLSMSPYLNGDVPQSLSVAQHADS